MAGVIAAEANNQLGIAGAAGEFDIRVMPVRVANYKGEAYVSDIVKGIDYAVEQQVDIINISMSSMEPSSFEREAVERAHDAGIIVVAAAGNNGDGDNLASYPASYDSVLSVASVDKYKRRSSFSTYNAFVDVATPGESILTTGKDGGYSTVSGTSFSSPLTAGVLAIMKGMNPELSPESAARLIKETAGDLGPAGLDDQFGHGLINAEKAVNATLQLPSALAAEWAEFEAMTVDRNKVFTISFSGPVALTDGSIYIAKNPDGTGLVKEAAIMVQADDPAKVDVLPVSQWQPGIYYLVVDNSVKSMDGRPHKKKVRMRFIVK